MAPKLAIVALITLLTTAAHAQGKPTLDWYGVADVYVAVQNTGAGYFPSLSSGGFNASRLGFRGEAPLGKDFAAVYLAESGIHFDIGDAGNGTVPGGINNSSPSSGGQLGNGPQFFARQIFAGVKSPYGTITGGRQYSPNYVIAAGLALPYPGMFGVSGALTAANGMPTRVNNSVYFASPSVAGVRVTAGGFAGNENNTIGNVPMSGGAFTNDKAGRGGDGAVFFRQGGLSLNVGGWYSYNTSFAATETELAVKKGYQVGGSYNVLGYFSLYGEFTQGRISGGNYENVTRALSKSTAWAAAAQIPYGNARLALTYANLNDQSLLDRDAELLGVQAWYKLGPQSNVYAAWAYMLNHGTSAYNIVDAGGLVATASLTPGADGRAFQLGFSQEF